LIATLVPPCNTSFSDTYLVIYCRILFAVIILIRRMVYVIANTLLITCFLMAEMVDSVALRFVLLGDWGKYSASRSKLPRSILRGQKTYYQTNVAKSMDAYCSEAIDGIAPCSFIGRVIAIVCDGILKIIYISVVALGDNFYDYGVQSTTDSRWAYVWKDIYHGVYSSLNIKWYPVFGMYYLNKSVCLLVILY
jgi:hypothetical protein